MTTPVNLITNGDAESGSGGGGEPTPTVPGWHTVEGAPALIRYSTGGGYPTATSPGPADRGAQFFGGGTSPRTRLVQTVRLPQGSRFTLRGWLGGYALQQDGARLSVEFLNASGYPLGVAVLGPVTAQERSSGTGLVERSATGPVPPGSTHARVTLLLTRSGGGSSNDGYADNLSLTVGDR
ncbi:hypothetical protein JOF53_000206 [Crossiella equi]|uniref:Phosphoesterase n=1 Tax=Crossiella equi TaxID=130796 RepID=A0ABS5A429_9PSEU|nr:phosphoesterase [Crossiella equi]MBP2471334.1 hypothetical protein [Crossiella equi]